MANPCANPTCHRLAMRLSGRGYCRLCKEAIARQQNATRNAERKRNIAEGNRPYAHSKRIDARLTWLKAMRKYRVALAAYQRELAAQR